MSAEFPESVAEIWRFAAVPDAPVWLPGFVTVTVFPVAGLIVQEKRAEPDAFVPSVAVTVTLEVPAVLGEPEISPALEMLRPAGRPVALKVRGEFPESVAEIGRLVAELTAPVWLPGLVTDTVLWIVQENAADPWAPVVSFAVTVTFDVPAVVGVPEISPVLDEMVRPAGRFVAL